MKFMSSEPVFLGGTRIWSFSVGESGIPGNRSRGQKKCQNLVQKLSLGVFTRCFGRISRYIFTDPYTCTCFFAFSGSFSRIWPIWIPLFFGARFQEIDRFFGGRRDSRGVTFEVVFKKLVNFWVPGTEF